MNQNLTEIVFILDRSGSMSGLENASREFSYAEVKKMITHQSEMYAWEFIFMGANIDVAAEGSKLGIDASRTFAFTASKAGIGDMFGTAAALCGNIRYSGIKQKKATSA